MIFPQDEDKYQIGTRTHNINTRKEKSTITVKDIFSFPRIIFLKETDYLKPNYNLHKVRFILLIEEKNYV